MKGKLKFLLTFIIVGSIVLSALYMTNNKMFIPTTRATIVTMSNITDFSGKYYINNGRTIARSSNGTLYSVCINTTTESSLPSITISESTDNGTTWSSSNLTFSFYDDLSQPHDQSYPTIAIDSKNNIYVFWLESFDIGYIGYKVYNATNQSWDNNGSLDITAGYPMYPACAVDNNDLVHVVFYSDDDYRIYHTTFDGMETGTSTQLTSSNSSDRPCIAINSTGGINVVWTAFSDNNTQFVQFAHSNDGGATWSTTYDVTPDINIQSVERPSIAINSSDIVSVVWTNYTDDGTGSGIITDGRIEYLSFDPTTDTWSSEVLLSTNEYIPAIWSDGTESECSISIDSLDKIHVIWINLDRSPEIHYNRSNNSNWFTTAPVILLSPSTYDYIYPNMIWAYHPTTGNSPNNPYDGYAFVYNNGTNISYYANCTWILTDNPPSISDVIATPSTESSGGYVNITCNVTDTDTTGISSVRVNISGPVGFTNVNQSMTLSIGNKYYYNTTYTDVGTYNFYIWANDTADLWSNSSNLTFEIVSNYAPIISNPNPTNGSWGNSLSLTWNITIEDTEGDLFNWTITVDSVGFNSGNYSTNGSQSVSLTGLSPGTTYTVYVNATDKNGSGTWTNETFWFLTNRIVVLSNPNPANESTGILLSQPDWNITIEDPDGDTFNYSIEMNPDVGGSFGYDNNNGSKNAALVGLVAGTHYIVYVNVTDNGTDLPVNATYWFNTTAAVSTVYVNKSYTVATPDYGVVNFSTVYEAVENVTVGGNVIVYPSYYNETVFIGKQINITGNYTTWRPSINCSVSNNNTITIQGAYNVTITGLNISNAFGKSGSYNAIQIGTISADSYYTHIENCTLKLSYSGALVRGGDHTLIANCTIFQNTYGLDLVGTTACFIRSNNINNNSQYGIYLNSFSISSVIDNNSISYNSLEGIRFTGGSSGNWIFHNNFINNNIGSKQASDNLANTNYWNLSYPQCGNYWGDWDQPSEGAYDRWWGPGQNMNGSDGIVDSGSPNPYDFTSDQDNYPFILPYNGSGLPGNINITAPIPANNSGNWSLWLPNVSINISSVYPFCYNITGSNINATYNNGTWVSSGTFTANVSNPLSYNTQYVWHVNATDGTNTSNATFYFWTNRAPNVTNEFPSNNSISDFHPYCHIDVSDFDGDLMTICWYENSSGTWTLNQSNVSVSNGTYYFNYSNATILYQTYWWMVTVNDSYTNVTFIYHFTVSPYTWKNVTWWNGTIINTFQPIQIWNGNINNQTHGGIYNITIFFENETEGVNHRVDLEQKNTGIHKFIIHYADGIDYVYFNNNGVSGSHYTTIAGYFNNNRSGNFTLVIDKQVKYFEFRWNDSTGRTWYCTRYTVPTANNVSMYIRTDLSVYGETTTAFNPSLVQYTLSFNDETGKFLEQNNPYVYFYTYNSSGVKQIIDAEYMDAESRVYPMLVYNEKYYIGVSCDVLTIDRIGDFVATSNTAQTDVRIPFQGAMTYTIYDLCTITAGWYAGGLYVDYVDTTFGTVAVECTIYYYINESLFLVKNYTYTDTQNFTFDLIEGINLTSNYKYQINTTLSGSTNSMFQGYYETGKCPIFAGISPITNNNTIDTIFTIIFGPSPIYNHDDPSIFVPWAYILVFIVSFVLMASFGKLNAFIGGLAVGLFLIFAGTTITGLNALYTQYPGWPGPTTVIIGAFITAISIISLIGGVEKR